MYYVIIGKKNKSMIVTQDFEEASNFILENRDAKIHTIDYNKKVKIMDKRVFLIDYFNNIGKKDRFFQMTEIIVKGSTNQNNLFTVLRLNEDYSEYKKRINVKL